MTVGMEEKEPIYRGEGQQNADFVLEIAETGSYHISISGHQAKGNISFTRIPAVRESNKRLINLNYRIITYGDQQDIAKKYQESPMAKTSILVTQDACLHGNTITCVRSPAHPDAGSP